MKCDSVTDMFWHC